MRTLCITSGKGGVGKTTLAVNLGLALSQSGRKVLLLDGDLGLANLNVMLGIIPKYSVHDLVRGNKELAEIVIETPYGLDLIAGANGIAELADMSASERQKVMQGLEALQGYDDLIIDTGAGISDTVIRFVLAADEVLVVITPHPTSLTDAYGIIKTVLSHESKAFKLVVNCASSPESAREAARRLTTVVEKFTGAQVACIGHIPLDKLIEKSILMQKPHLVLSPGSASAARIRDIARALIAQPLPARPTKAAGFLQRLLGYSRDARS